MIMNKKGLIILIIIGVSLIIVGTYFYFTNSNNNDSNNQNDYEANKTSRTESIPENTVSEAPTNQNKTIANQQNEKDNTPQYSEEQLSTFSTTIYSKDSARQNNIQITCNSLNGTTVKNGETFSFCDTVGQATSAKGYQKADIFDRDGNKKKGLGGGNCQVSSTLYNTVIATPNLVVIERHEHSNDVPYVPKGKDAAVAYGSYDLKFRNNTGNDIKINCSTDGNSVTTAIIALKQTGT